MVAAMAPVSVHVPVSVPLRMHRRVAPHAHAPPSFSHLLFTCSLPELVVCRMHYLYLSVRGLVY
ncbi:hypothetical protein V8C42DRAFT_313086 [Trichoderma barbatum]